MVSKILGKLASWHIDSKKLYTGLLRVQIVQHCPLKSCIHVYDFWD